MVTNPHTLIEVRLPPYNLNQMSLLRNQKPQTAKCEL
jgi:hypothetical protein